MIRQFDVVENPSASASSFVRYAVVLSSHYLEGTGSIILAPLTTEAPVSRIDVQVIFQDEALTLSVAELMSFDTRIVGQALGNLSFYEDEVRRALERVFTGF